MNCGLTERTRGMEEEGRAMVMLRERREGEMKTLSERRKEEKVKEERDEGLK